MKKKRKFWPRERFYELRERPCSSRSASAGHGNAGSEPLGAVELAQVPVERAQRQLASLAGHFQNQTVGEAQAGAPLP
jgi:hypothetical protein